jgi:hypothetical protein
MVCVQYLRHRCCTTSLSRQCQPCRNRLISWVEYMELNYDMIFLLQHILYLYCIHDNIAMMNYNAAFFYVNYKYLSMVRLKDLIRLSLRSWIQFGWSLCGMEMRILVMIWLRLFIWCNSFKLGLKSLCLFMTLRIILQYLCYIGD